MEQRIAIEFNAHTAARPCHRAIEQAALGSIEEDWTVPVRLLADLVEASKEDAFVFTSSGAEAVGQVIWSVFSEISRKEGKTQFITTCLEDAPILQMLKRCEEWGGMVKIAPAGPDGRLDVAALEKLITPRTALISLGIAQGLTGVVQPIEEIAAVAKAKGVLLHLDGSSALGKIYVSLAALGADYLTFCGERIYSVRGTGGLFAKKGSPLIPLILGGSSQNGLRGGGYNPGLLAALGAAGSLAAISLDTVGLEGARLRDLFETELERKIPGLQICFRESARLPNTSAIIFPKVHAESLRYYLERRSVFPNGEGNNFQYLPALLASSGISTESALSFSMSRMNSEEEVLRAAAILVEEVGMLQKISEKVFA